MLRTMSDGNPDGALMGVAIGLRASVGESTVITRELVDQAAIGVAVRTASE